MLQETYYILYNNYKPNLTKAIFCENLQSPRSTRAIHGLFTVTPSYESSEQPRWFSVLDEARTNWPVMFDLGEDAP